MKRSVEDNPIAIELRKHTVDGVVPRGTMVNVAWKYGVTNAAVSAVARKIGISSARKWSKSPKIAPKTRAERIAHLDANAKARYS